jgi:hypothetical protein
MSKPQCSFCLIYAEDEKAAIEKAIMEFKVPAAHRSRLMAKPGRA